MTISLQLMQRWAKTLQQWGVNDWLATVLEAAGPFSILGAQMVYLCQPLLGKVVSPASLDALAQMLEEPEQTGVLVHLLRQPEADLQPSRGKCG